MLELNPDVNLTFSGYFQPRSGGIRLKKQYLMYIRVFLRINSDDKSFDTNDMLIDQKKIEWSLE